jgi:malonyl-CoA O-methyltransferase
MIRGNRHLSLGVGRDVLDKARIKASFSRQAKLYDESAGLQQEVGRWLISQIGLDHQPVRLLDIGMGTGFLARKLCRYNPNLRLYGCDIAHGMNLYAAHQLSFSNLPVFPVTADAEHLCYKTKGIDLVISNLSYQWLNDIGQGLREAYRVLKPGGSLVLTTLGEKSLNELTTCFYKAHSEQKGQAPAYTHRFIEPARLLSLMQQAAFGRIRLKSRLYLRRYRELSDLFKVLKQLGATNASINRPPGLASKAIIRRTQALYQKRYGQNGHIYASYNVLLVSGIKRG